MPFSSVLCCCLDGRGHVFLGSVPLGVAQLFALENQRKRQKAEVSGQCCGMGPLPLCPFLPYCRAPQGARGGRLGCHAPEAAWKVFVGVSRPVCFKPVGSALPAALVNGVSREFLSFVHPFQRDCCSRRSGRNWACLQTQGRSTALFIITSFRHRISYPPFPLDTG